MITDSFVLNFSRLQDAAKTYDYQIELVTIWSNHLEADKSGVLEWSVNHGDGCMCCSSKNTDSIRDRKEGGRL
jgi:hypothetical protein